MEYDDNNIFAKILREEAPCFKIFEDEYTLAFLDIMPQLEGHTLVIPKEPAVTIYDLSDQAALACMKTVKFVGKVLETAMDFRGSTVFQHNGVNAGQTVPHFHFHVFPGSIVTSGFTNTHATKPANPIDLERTASKIHRVIRGINTDY